MRSLICRTDGACRGNPGPASIGVALYDADDRLLFFNQRFVDQYDGLEEMLEVGVTFEAALRSAHVAG